MSPCESRRRTLPAQAAAAALDAVPAAVRDHGLVATHPWPLVSLGKRAGFPFSSFRASPRCAWRFPEIELGRSGSAIAALVFDCDDPAAWRVGLADLPPPSWIVTRPANDHAHVAYTLARPVHRFPAARREPLRFLAHVAEYFQAALGADGGYAGVLSHNPALESRQDRLRTEWGARRGYTLGALASVIPFNWQPPRVRQSAIGRNAALFEAGMGWAGRRANAALAVLPALHTVNQRFACPLPEGELAAAARSIERYRERWAAHGWHSPAWVARQRARKARQAGKARRDSASSAGSNEALQPWRADGISRRTWYRRRAAAAGGTVANTDKCPEGEDAPACSRLSGNHPYGPPERRL